MFCFSFTLCKHWNFFSGRCTTGLSAEFLPKVSAEIRQKVFLHLFGLSVLLQKHFLSAECQSFCRNCSFLQLESCFEGSMVLHLSWNSYKFPFLHPILCKILHSKELLTCRKNLFLQKDAISAERPSFGSFCISAERNIFGRLSFCFLQNDKISLSVNHYRVTLVVSDLGWVDLNFHTPHHITFKIQVIPT